MTVLLYGVGVGEFGQSYTFSTRDPAPEVVEVRFRRRWRELSLTTDDGTVVGEIRRHPETGRRTWWADGSVNDTNQQVRES